MTASAAAALVFGGVGVVPARAESLNAVLAQAASRAAGDVAVLPAAEGESVTVTTAQEFIDALTKGTAPIIKIGANIDLNDVPGGSKTTQNAINNAASKRSVVIESAEGGRYTLDFGTYAFNMGSGTTTNPNVTVTMKNLDLYGQNYFSMISNAGTYNFENVSYTGSQMVYANKGDINYYGNVTAKSVVSFTNAATGKTYDTAGSGNQQVIEGGTAIFKAGSNVTLATEAGNVLEIKSGGSGVIVEEGANVTIAPRSKVTAEHPTPAGGYSYGIDLNGSNLVVQSGATLNVDVKQESGDKGLSGAITMTGGATIEVSEGAALNITTSGQWANTVSPVTLTGAGAAINVEEGASFTVDAKNVGTYSGNIVNLGTGATISANPYSTFTVAAQGAGNLSAINVGSGATMNVDQPELFDINLTQNTGKDTWLVSSGTVNVNNSRQLFDSGQWSEPINEMTITYARGKATVKSLESTTQDAENAIKANTDGKTANRLTFSKAGAAVDIVDDELALSDDNKLTGRVTVDDGSKDTLDNQTDGISQDVYISVTVNTQQAANKVDPRPYWRQETTNYQVKTGADGTFSVDLSEFAALLEDGKTTIAITATKDFIDDTASKTVVELRAQNKKYEPVYTGISVEEGKSSSGAAPTFKLHADGSAATPPATVSYALGSGAPAAASIDAGTGAVTFNASGVEAGTYSVPVVVTYSDGTVDTVDVAVTVSAEQAVDKSGLAAEIAKEPGVKAGDYQTATPDAQAAYDKALSDAQAVNADPDATQAEVDAAKAALEEASKALGESQAPQVDKSGLAAEIAKEPGVKAGDYQTATPDAQAAYDKALSDAQAVNADPDATQAEVDAAKAALEEASKALGESQAVDKSSLIDAIIDANGVKSDDAFKNASDETKQALEEALDAAEQVRDNPDATAAEVKEAEQALKDAIDALDGQPTNTDELGAAIDDANAAKDTDAYANATDEAKEALEAALDAAEKVYNDPNATQDQVDTAKENLENAKNALDGKETDKSGLQTAITDANDSRGTDAYTNASDEAKQALEQALSEAQAVNADPDATQAEVDAAKQKLEDAKNALDGQPTDKTALESSIGAATDSKGTDAFANASDGAKAALEAALAAAEKVYSDPTATQDQVDTAKANLDAAVKNLDGKATDTSELESAINDAKDTQGTDAYNNASPDKKDALDQAISEAEEVLGNPDATQAEVDAAKQKLEDAKNALDGKETDKSGLKASIDASDGVKASDGYKNASDAAKDAYDKALAEAEAVYAKDGATQAEVDAAKAKLDQAAGALDGKATDKSGLQTEIDNAGKTKDTDAYENASQEAKDAFDKALADAEAVLKDPNASQAEVDRALANLADAAAKLDGASGSGTGTSGGKKTSGRTSGKVLPKTGDEAGWTILTPVLVAMGSLALFFRKRFREDEEQQ